MTLRTRTVLFAAWLWLDCESNPERATLQDLVQDVLKTKLAYSDEISVLSEKGLVYDLDLEDNLEKKLEELGVSDTSFIVIKDDSGDETIRVDLQLAIEAKTNEADSCSPAVQLLLKDGETLEVPRRPRKKRLAGVPDSLVNGTNAEAVNGTGDATNSTKGKRKRDADEAELDVTEGTPMKKMHLSKQADEKGILVVDDDDGAIVLD